MQCKMENIINKDIVVIGAGLTGLTTAYYLSRAGKDVMLMDKEKRCGGAIQTLNEGGFLFEAGPNTGVLSSPELVSLFDDMKGKCRAQIANPEAKKRWILKNGRWRALPSGPLSAIATPLFSWKDKFRILAEPFRKPGSDPMESVAGLVKRRMGTSYLHYAVDPYIAGIYAGDPEKLVTRYAMPKLYNLEQNYGSFIRGAIKKRKEPKSEIEQRATREVFSVEGGIDRLIEALSHSIPQEQILLNCLQSSVTPERKGFRVVIHHASGEKITIRCNHVVTTSGGFSLPFLLPFIREEEMEAIASLEYARVAQVAVGFNRWNGIKLDAFGGLVPSLEKRNILGILFPSAIFQGRAPEGGALLSVFIGGMRNPEVYAKDDETLKAIAIHEIRNTLQCTNAPDLVKIFRYPFAIPQYGADSLRRLAAIERIERDFPGLILAGNIRDGIGMADRVKQGRKIADSLI